MKRILWLDASRGLAILLLVVIHYIGALETRGVISAHTFDVFRTFLRLATPFFIFTFGFVFYITASKKLVNQGLASYYRNTVLPRLGYILLARQIIVCILSLRYPDVAENFWSIFFVLDFNAGGEILIFYFLALLLTPLNFHFLQKVNVFVYLSVWSVLYAISYYIGSSFIDLESNNILRILFYDIYAFFPFMMVAALAMLCAKVFINSDSQDKVINGGFIIGLSCSLFGFLLLTTFSENVWQFMGVGDLKKPPHVAYLLFYIGEVLVLISTIATLYHFIPKFVQRILSVFGRNPLLAYVAHYTLFSAKPISNWLGGGKLLELAIFVIHCLLIYTIVKKWDEYKFNRKLPRDKVPSEKQGSNLSLTNVGAG